MFAELFLSVLKIVWTKLPLLHYNVCAYKLFAVMPVCVFCCVYTLQMTYRDLLQRTLTIFQPQSFIVTFFTNEASEWVVGGASL